MILVTIVAGDGSREAYPMEHLPQVGDRLLGYCGRACMIVRERAFMFREVTEEQAVMLRCD